MGWPRNAGPEKMETHPPKLIEDIVGLLVPPAYREHVLGDWHERYTSVSRYLLDVAATLPLIITSQIRRTFRIELFVAELCGLYIAFASGSLIRGPGYLYDEHVVLPLALVIGVVLAVLVFRDAYADPRDESSRKTLLDAGLAVTFAYVAQGVFGLLSSRLLLPPWLMFTGTVLSLPLLIAVRKSFGSIHRRPNRPMPAAVIESIEQLHHRFHEENRQEWPVNFVWLAAALLVLSTNWNPASWLKVVALLALGVSWLYVRRLHKRGPDGSL